MSSPVVSPDRDLSHGCLEHFPRDGVHQPDLLDDREECVRVEQPAGGVLPAHERLRAEDGTGGHVDLRLVVQHELVAIERGVEVLDRLEPDAVGLIELRVVALRPGVGVLGGVHRDIGASEQIDDADRLVVAFGDAGARVDEQPRAVDGEGLRDPIEDPDGDLAAFVGGRERDQEGELVTPQPHEQVVVRSRRRRGAARSPGAARRPRDDRSCR